MRRSVKSFTLMSARFSGQGAACGSTSDSAALNSSAGLCRKDGGVIQPANDRREGSPACVGLGRERIQQDNPPEEVTFLVKDLSGVLVEAATRAQYEEGNNQGRHYAEMLPKEEYRPTARPSTFSSTP